MREGCYTLTLRRSAGHWLAAEIMAERCQGLLPSTRKAVFAKMVEENHYANR